MTKRAAFTHPALEGATVVVTRPAGTSSALVRRVQGLGGRALALPGVALRAADKPPSRPRAAFDAWIFMSPAAVRFGADALPRARARLRTYAIGEGTAHALARRGVSATIPVERADSEGLLALPELKRVRGQRIALVGAPGGRDLIAPALRRRGARVEAIHVYRRVPPRLTRRHFDALAEARDPLITLVSSGEALANLVALLPAPLLARLRAQILVVSSARLAALARSLAFAEIVLARSAVPRDLLAAAADALARHRL
ncbi:MAG TPA: uroporphyrinogen-III synthase [Rhodanobacteraceae bacterium]|nr:uroporphyrinogen-III synthase [Rhodanobacteraceae bacterium]